MNNDNVIGAAKKIEGSVQRAYGTVTGNKSAEAKGDKKRVFGAAQEAFGKAEEYVQDSYEHAKDHITENPLRSALVALGVGFLLGRLI